MSKYEFYLANARTYCMMYRVTGQPQYLKQARECLDRAYTMKVGFMRPLGALAGKAA